MYGVATNVQGTHMIIMEKDGTILASWEMDGQDGPGKDKNPKDKDDV